MDQEEFDSLDIEQQIKIFAESPVSEKGDLILRSHEPDKLTSSLASEELYLILKEMDSDEKREIIKYASLDQLFFISDIDCWQKDRISSESFIQWLETLRQADERRFYVWLAEMDYEVIVAGLMQFVRVLKPEWEYAVDDQLGDEPYFTLDNFYYIVVDEENLETVRRAFELLYENHRGRYVAVLEGILSEVAGIIEEEAYARREIRLSDRGFPDYETAMRAYVPLDREGFERFELKNSETMVRIPGDASVSPNYLVLWTLQPLFLDKVISSLGEKDAKALDSFYEELAWLCNKLVVCHGMDFTSEGKVRWAVERARSLLSLGVELLSEGDIDQAVQILRTRWIETAFRYSVGLLYKIRDEMQSIVRHHWNAESEAILEFMDAPYDSIAKGFLEKIPLAYDFETSENIYHLREFQSPEDIQRAHRALLQLKIIHEKFEEKASKKFNELKKEIISGDTTKTLIPVLGTIYVRYVLSKNFDWKPLKLEEVRAFIKKAFEPEGSIRRLREDAKEQFWTGLFSPEERDLLIPLFGIVFQRIQEQMGFLDPDGPIETYVLTGVLMKLE